MVEVRILWSAHLFCNMKKKLLIVALVAGLLPTLFSCTENQRARQFGGTITIELPPGEKLVMATWKETDPTFRI